MIILSLTYYFNIKTQYTENNEQYDSDLFQELDSGKSIIFTVQAPNDAHIGFL